MTKEIPKREWERFFDAVGKNYLEWQTKVEILKDDIGAQVLSKGLPLIGFLCENKTNRFNALEIMLGDGAGAPQTHTIFNVQRVFFKMDDDNSGGTIDIEDRSGAKTIVHLVQPIPVLAVYAKPEMLAFSFSR